MNKIATTFFLLFMLFMAVIEATEEAILNSLFAAKSMEGNNGHRVECLPVQKVPDLLKNYKVLDK